MSVMNIKEFSELFAQKCGVTKGRALEYCRAFVEQLDECFDSMDAGDRITFYGFGAFAKKIYPAHLTGDPQHGGTMEVPSKARIVFSRSKTLLTKTPDQ